MLIHIKRIFFVECDAHGINKFMMHTLDAGNAESPVYPLIKIRALKCASTYHSTIDRHLVTFNKKFYSLSTANWISFIKKTLEIHYVSLFREHVNNQSCNSNSICVLQSISNIMSIVNFVKCEIQVQWFVRTLNECSRGNDQMPSY